jgi:hypothetical protein
MKLTLQIIATGLLLAGVIILLNSCATIRRADRCDPSSIRSGRSAQYHDSKKMRAAATPHPEKIRVMWIHQDGPVYHVRFANMKTTLPRVYFEKLPSLLIQEGTWVPVDSLCTWDTRSDSIAKL